MVPKSVLALLFTALLLTGCSQSVTGTAVTAAGRAPDEPHLRVALGDNPLRGPTDGAGTAATDRHTVVARSAGTTYLATVTTQTTDDEDPTFVSAAQEILDGFQMLAPTS